MAGDYSEFKTVRGRSGKVPSTGTPKGGAKDVPDRTANWPGKPLRSQPRDRSNGVPRGRFQLKPDGL